jgi:hypothetical protein
MGLSEKNMNILNYVALLFLPFRKKATLPSKRRLLMLPGVFQPALAILVCMLF